MEVCSAHAANDKVLTTVAYLGGLDLLSLSREQCRDPVCASFPDWYGCSHWTLPLTFGLT
jgi:hypothetical protein